MKKSVVAPRIPDGTKQWYGENFQTTNTGVVFILESFPELYKRAILELKGRFSKEELYLILDVYDDTTLISGMPMLQAQVHDGIFLNGLDHKREVDQKEMTRKIESLTSFQSVVLEVWARKYWLKSEGKRPRELEKYAESLI